MESFPVLSRTSSRNMERDWENGSIASSVTSAEYNGEQKYRKRLHIHPINIITAQAKAKYKILFCQRIFRKYT